MTALEESLTSYFSSNDNLKQMLIIHHSRTVQPRLIDFFITQYSKKYPQFYIHNTHGICDIYNSYKLQLKGYHKKHFNLFGKDNKVKLGKNISIALSKLNVYRWILDNDVLKCINLNKFDVQNKYSDFRKSSSKKHAKIKNKKRGKMSVFIKQPHIIKLAKHVEFKSMLS